MKPRTAAAAATDETVASVRMINLHVVDCEQRRAAKRCRVSGDDNDIVAQKAGLAGFPDVKSWLLNADMNYRCNMMADRISRDKENVSSSADGQHTESGGNPRSKEQ